MVRAVLLGLLTLSAVSCKSHDESQAKSQPGIAAGKVVEVTGSVTLHHGTETRPLAKGDVIDADDVVETGADGSAVIEVAHNNVNWEIGAGKKGTMRESLAWTEPKKDKAAKATEQDSAAAGRHAERSAADNSATAAERESAAEAPAAEAPKAEAAMAPPADTAAPPPVAAPTAPPVTAAPAAGGGAKKQATRSAPPPPPPPPPGGAAQSESMPAPKPTPPPAPPAKIAAPQAATTSRNAPADMKPSSDDAFGAGGLGLSGTGEGGGGTGDGIGIGTIGHGGGTGTGQGYGAGKGSVTARKAPTAQGLLDAKNAQLKACLKSGTTMHLKIEVDAAGKAKLLFLDKTDWPADTSACVKKIVDGITFPKQASSVTATIKA
ncbi:MAG TPA: hypothetical protein VMZ53_17890 [Kofleriaceae bacterium]|nr:hypothetical protein [Kofleriaceae bacterium]